MIIKRFLHLGTEPAFIRLGLFSRVKLGLKVIGDRARFASFNFIALETVVCPPLSK